MRAAVLTTPGEAPGWAEHPDPPPTPGRSLVAVTAAPVVPLDLLCASGTSYCGTPAVPYVPGVQGVGVVVDSSTLAVGSRVWFATSAGMTPGDGSLAERSSVADADLVPVPDGVADPVAASLGLSAVAAWMALTWRGRLQPGERVVVLGGGGAVGQVAVGAARLLGAARVVAVSRPGASADRARRAGADEVVELSPDADALTAVLREACGGDVDLVVDPVFGTAATAASRVLAGGGRLVNLGSAGGETAEFSSAVLRSRQAEVLGYTKNALSPVQRTEALTAVFEHAAAGRLAVEHEVLPMPRVAEAWATTAQGGVRQVLSREG